MAVVRRNKDLKKVELPSEMQKAIDAIRKRHGNSIVVAGDQVRQPWRIPTGVFTFDLATLGGIPHGRCSMAHGPKHSGKTFMSMRCIAGAQKSMPDQRAVLVDVEGTYDAVWAEKSGVDNASLILSQPETGEMAVDIAVELVRTREVSLVVVDSLAALVPIKEQEEDAGTALVALQARLITSMMRKITAAQIAERHRGHYVTLLTINQQRTKIGGWSPTGDPISLPGGKAIGFFNSLEWRMKNKETTGKGEDGRDILLFNEHAFTIEKNKMNSGSRTGDFRLMRADKPDMHLTEGEVDDAAIMLAMAKAAGWYDGSPRQGYSLTVPDYEPVTQPNADAMLAALYEDRDWLWALRCNLIAREAARQKMPPWYVEYLRTGVPVDAE